MDDVPKVNNCIDIGHHVHLDLTMVHILSA
jgi:hypothetical protein